MDPVTFNDTEELKVPLGELWPELAEHRVRGRSSGGVWIAAGLVLAISLGGLFIVLSRGRLWERRLEPGW